MYFNIEPYILNWSGYKDSYHFIAYTLMTLMKLDNNTFNIILNDCKTMSPKQLEYKYSKTKYKTICYNCYMCVIRNIDIKKEYKQILKYITSTKKIVKNLYRGENRINPISFTNN